MKLIIEDYFDTKKGKFREIIDDYFNKDDGQIKGLIDDTFDLDNKKSALSLLIEELKENSELKEEVLQELLDPNKTDSPVWQLREHILDRINDLRERELKGLSEKISELRENEIKEIRDEVLKKAAIESEKEKGTSKGMDFQEEVYSVFESLAKPYEDKIIPIGEKRGIKDKKGDILIQLKNKKSVVVECKDSSSYSCKKTMEEIRKSIDNRKASFGIFIFAKRDEMPKELCPIKITDNYIITCYEKENLYLSYRIARILVLREDDSGNKINFEKISSELNNIEELIKSINNMQLKVSNIITSGTYLRSNLEILRDGIEESIKKIKNVLGNKFDSHAIQDLEDDNIDEVNEEYSFD